MRVTNMVGALLAITLAGSDRPATGCRSGEAGFTQSSNAHRKGEEGRWPDVGGGRAFLLPKLLAQSPQRGSHYSRTKIFDNVYIIGNSGTAVYVIQTSGRGLSTVDALGADQVETRLLAADFRSSASIQPT